MPVWVLSTAVGSGQTCTPIADRIGRITVREQRPNPERSWIASTLPGLFSIRFLHNRAGLPVLHLF